MTSWLTVRDRIAACSTLNPFRGGRLTWLFVLATLLPLAPLLAQDKPATPTDHAKSLSTAFRAAAATIKPAVVTVTTSYRYLGDQQGSPDRPRVPGLQPFPREDGDPDDIGRPTSVGSGVVVDPKGIVLTNNHVVEGAREVMVRLADGSEYKATDIRTDPYSDLAVLKIQPDAPIAAAKLGDSSQLEIGDWVIAVGSPFDLEATVSAGIISAKGRTMSLIRGVRLLQTDAAINPGNSGGALADLHGEVIGINTAIATSTGTFQGVGFAIPINQAKWISKDLLENGKVRRSWLGVRIGELTAKDARFRKLPARSGVLIVEVRKDGPAEKAGLKNDDVVTDFAGIKVRASGELQDVVEQLPPGSVQEMHVVRDGKPIVLRVNLEAFPETYTVPLSEQRDNPNLPDRPKRKNKSKE